MELSGMEMVAVLLIALLVLGPDEMIKYAVKLGRFVAKMKTQFENFKKMTQEEFTRRADVGDMSTLKDLKSQVESLGVELKGQLDHVTTPRDEALKPSLGSSETEIAKSLALSELEVESNLLKLKSKG